MRGGVATLLAGLLLAALPGCAADDESPETQVRRLFADVEQAVREKDLKALKGFISESYRDPAGRGKREVSGLLTGYYLRRGSVHLLVRVRDLAFPEPGIARVELLAAMARMPLLDWGQVPELRADAFVFEVELLDEDGGEWRVTAADWRRASLDDLHL